MTEPTLMLVDDVPIVLMAGYSKYHEFSAKTRQAGAAAMITKPFNMKDLMASLVPLLAKIPQQVAVPKHVASSKHYAKRPPNRAEKA